MILPHELFAALWAAGRWNMSVGTEDTAEEHWQHACRYFDWTEHHPVKTHAAFPRRMVPISIYGDGAKVTRDEHMVVLTWNSCLVKGAAIDCKFLMVALPQPHLRPESLDAVARIIKWSFGCMWDGTWPCTDHLARPWPKHHPRAWKSGTQLAGDWAAVLTESRGDWEWQAKFFHTPTSTTRKPCWLCSCDQHGAHGWPLLQQEAPRPADWLAKLPVSNPLTELPGFNKTMVKVDLMHTVCLGVCIWTNAGSLLWLCERGHWPGDSLASQLHHSWCSFREWCQSRGLDTSQKPFTPRKLLVHKREYAEFQCKAWNSRLLCNWLAAEMQRLDHSLLDATGALTTGLQWQVNESIHLLEASGRFLTQREADRYHELVDSAVRVYCALAHRHLQEESLRYPLRPKLHLWLECARLCRRDRYNPRFFHCFADESHLRLLLSAARASPRATMGLATSRRYLLRLSHRWRGLERVRRPRARALLSAVGVTKFPTRFQTLLATVCHTHMHC